MERAAVLVAAQDTGAANALVPVIRTLDRHSEIQRFVAASGNAVKVFSREGIRFEEVGRDPVQALLDRTDPALLLLGTAWGHSLDKCLLKDASGEIPSVSVVDNWSYFSERFTDPATGQKLFPTRIAVVDERALEEAVKEGIPRALLVATGQPYLDSIPGRLQEVSLQGEAKALRQCWLERETSPGLPSRVILFASEAFTRYSGPQTHYYRGYTEADALEGLVEAVQGLQEVFSESFQLVVKLHPEESLSPFRPGPKARQRGFLVCQEESPLACILAADLVVGMASMFLLEASLAGRFAISFQPGAQEAYPFVGSEIGLVPPASSVEELREFLHLGLTGKARPSGEDSSIAPGDAAVRIVELALELLQGKVATSR